MKIKIQKEALVSLASKAASVVEKKTPQPSLAWVVLTAAGERLEVGATDLFTSIRASATCEVAKPGAVAVDAHGLARLAASLPEGEVTMTQDGLRLRVQSGGSRYTLPAASPVEHPLTGDLFGEKPVEVDGADLKTVIDAVLCATSSDTSRPHLAAGLLEVSEGRIRAVATDSSRMHVRDARRTGDAKGTLEVLIPTKGLHTITRNLSTGPVTLSTKQNDLFLEQGDTRLGIRLVDGGYVPYAQVIPKGKSRTSAVVEREALLAATRRLMQVNQAVKLSTEDGVLQVAADHPDAGDGAEDVSASCVKGCLVRLGGKFLVEALAKSTFDEVELEYEGELDPVVVRAEDYLAVIMPMRG